jgi:hypothetical protein
MHLFLGTVDENNADAENKGRLFRQLDTGRFDTGT